MSAEEAEQLLEGVQQNSETLQEQLQQFYAPPFGNGTEEDW